MDNHDIMSALTTMELEEIEPSFPMPPSQTIEHYLGEILDFPAFDVPLISVEVDCENGPYVGQWKEIENISRKNIPAIHNSLQRHFSDSSPEQKIRALFPDEIECKCWHLINTEEPVSQESLTKAMAIKDSLQDLARKSLQDENFSLQADDRIKLQQFYTQLQRDQLKATDLVKIYQKMLKREHGIIMSARDSAQAIPNGHMNRPPSYESPGVPQRFQGLSSDITEMQERTREISGKIGQMATDFQRLHLCTNGNIHIIDSYDMRQITNPNEVRMWQTIVNLRQSLVTHRRNLIEYHRDNVFLGIKSLLSKIDREIKEWRRAQAFACNGKYVESYDIDQLEDCCKPTAGLMNLCLEQIANLAQLEVDTVDDAVACQEILEGLRIGYENLVKELVVLGLVVEKQPPQVLMKDKKFVCHLRHLVSDGLTIHQFNFTTKVALVTSDVANNIRENGTNTQIITSGEIVNNSKNSDYNDQLKQLRVLMTNMTLKMKMRGDKGRADTVAEEKYCMVFRSQIHLRLANNKEYEVTAQTMSLPIVVISHGKQEADAQATIFWDNAFSDAFRRPFETPNQVQWSWIIDSLHWLWKKECESDSGGINAEGIGLNQIARKYLTQKLLGHEAVPSDTMVSWKQFNHENLPGKTFTFWKWFFNIMQLVSSPYVRKYWNLGLIHGFIGKASCQKMLLQCSPGTFMFRFSDTVLGALSISCYTVCKDGTDPHAGYEVGHLQPDTVKKFQQRSLPDMVKDIQYLHFLYPNMPKDHVFGSYYTPEQEENNGYWKKHVVVVAPFGSRPGQSQHSIHNNGELLSPGSMQETFSPTSSHHDDFVMSKANPDYWTKDLQVVVVANRTRPDQCHSPGQAITSSMHNNGEVFSPGSVGSAFSPNPSRHESLDFTMSNESQ